MKEAWRSLRVDDLIRIIKVPIFQPQYRETMRVYRKLIARRRALRVYQIDKDGLPWVQCRFRLKDGRWEHHFLAIDFDDCWIKIRHRSPTTRKTR